MNYHFKKLQRINNKNCHVQLYKQHKMFFDYSVRFLALKLLYMRSNVQKMSSPLEKRDIIHI